MKDLKYYLGLPYTTVLKRDEDGDIVARVQELKGCSAHGADEREAIENLRESMKLWIEETIAAEQTVPEPDDVAELPSGKWVQRVARSLHRKLARAAKEESVSLNHLVATILAEAVGLRSAKEKPAVEVFAKSAEWAWANDTGSRVAWVVHVDAAVENKPDISNLNYIGQCSTVEKVMSLKKVNENEKEKARDKHLNLAN